MVYSYRLLLLAAGILLGIGCARDDAPWQTPDGTAAVRFIHTLPGPAVQLAFDGEPLGDLPWQEEVFRTSWVHPYVEYPAGEYRFSAITMDDESRTIGSLPVTLKTGEQYGLTLYETGDGEPALLWIEETAALAGRDPQEEAVYILVNIIDGAPPLQVVIEGETMLSDVAYGSYKLGVDPQGPVEGIDVYAGEEILFEWPDVETFYPGAYFLQIYGGQFPGRPWRDYFAFSLPTYAGEPAVEAGEPVSLNEEIEGRIPATGIRIRHPLALAQPTTATFTLSRLEPKESVVESDFELQLYDADERLLTQSIGDGSGRLVDVELPAGEYFIEVSRFFDVGAGGYRLRIESENTENK